MRIFRVAQHHFIQDLSGEGARLYGGRWNKKGDAMLYFSEHLSLCVLELLVHMDYQFISDAYWFIEAEIPDKLLVDASLPKSLSQEWRSNPPSSRTQDFGSQWMRTQNELAMRLPSAVLPTANNIIVNPNHTLIGKLKIVRTERLQLDARLSKING